MKWPNIRSRRFASFVATRKFLVYRTGVGKLPETILNQVLEADISEQVAAEHYKRTEERKGYRKGIYPHRLTKWASNNNITVKI